MKKKLFLLFLACISLSAMAQTTIIRVKSDAAGLNNGASWVNAYNKLEDALQATQYHPAITEIRVAVGEYEAPAGNGFIIPKGVSVYGCFNGTDNYDPYTTAPDTVNYKTTLKANAQGGRVLTQLTNFAANKKALWSGFTITGGNAAKAEYQFNYGGGTYIGQNTTLQYCHFMLNKAYKGGGAFNMGTITNSSFTNNTAKNGGGTYNYGIITNSSFTGNWTQGEGGGAYNENGIITNSSFTGNDSQMLGGGAYNENGTITNCSFTDNTAFSGGGVEQTISAITINSLFTGNKANFGGGIRSTGTTLNCTFVNNTANGIGGGAYNEGVSSKLTNCIVWNNNAPTDTEVFTDNVGNIKYNTIKAWAGGGTKNTNVNPLLNDTYGLLPYSCK